MNESKHWDRVYEGRGPDQVSWYRPHLEHSLSLIDQARLPPDAAIIDVGGGASTLVDDLLDRGHHRFGHFDEGNGDGPRAPWRQGSGCLVAGR